MTMRNGLQRRPIMHFIRGATVAPHVVAMSALVGCSSGPTLPRTPNLYLDGDVAAMPQIAPEGRTTDVDILYATDREPNESESSAKRYYDERRSDSLSVAIRFCIGEHSGRVHMSWRTLARGILAMAVTLGVTAAVHVTLARTLGPGSLARVAVVFSVASPAIPLVIFGLLGFVPGLRPPPEIRCACRACGHELRGLREPRCPECGEVI